MQHLHLADNLLYDGSQIRPQWAFKEFGIKDSTIITWIGPMNIISEELIDFQDRGKEIKAQKMIHFIVEHFDCQPADIRMAYHRQRILVLIIKDILIDMGIICERQGDDLFVHNKKLTVSIASCSLSSMKIHMGLNLTSEGTPADVETIGLLEIESYSKSDISDFINKISKQYMNEISSIEKDITKTRILQ